MKKYLVLVLIVLIIGTLVIGVQVASGKKVDAQRVPLYPVSGGSSDNVLTLEPSQGEVIFVDPMGDVTFIIQGNVEGLLPDQCYGIWIRQFPSNTYTGSFINAYSPLGYYMLETFITNGIGKGHFHLNIRSEDLLPGTYLIQLAINNSCDPGDIGITVLATEKYTEVTVKE